MGIDKLVDSSKLDACCTAEADAIRAKTGGAVPLNYDFANNKGFSDAIVAIPTGQQVPAGFEIGTFTPTEEEDTHTVSHSLGVVPKIAFVCVQANGDWDNIPLSAIVYEMLGSDPQTGTFDISLSTDRRINSVASYNSNNKSYLTTSTWTTYPAEMTNNSVTFATGRYYSGKFKAGLTYFYLLMK